MNKLFEPLTLPNGVMLANRICKASMEENLAEQGQLPGARLQVLYRQWSKGGAGLILTGNVMISPNALTGSGGVVLDKDQALEPFKAWARAAKSGEAKVWMQINHPGRQVYASMGEEAVAPSPISVNIRGFESLFSEPRALEAAEITDIIQSFANTARLAEQAGFDGCQIHAAHGYLISQFLSPLTNQRDDIWGGSLDNRSRLLFDVITAIDDAVSTDFCIAVKLNSADFQKGGFDEVDAQWVVEKLNATRVDLVELSGGSYESPAMQGGASKDNVNKREAYFIDFARHIACVATMPIMVTGGIRNREVAVDALKDDEASFGVQLLGIARAMAFVPDLPNAWQRGERLDVVLPSVNWKNKTLAALAVMAITKFQLSRLSKGKKSRLKINPMLAVVCDRAKIVVKTKRYRRWRNNQSI